MKRISVALIAIVSLTALFTTSCIDDQFDSPPIGSIPVGTVYTLQEIIDSVGPSGSLTFTEDASIYATVTMDERSGNIYTNVYAQSADSIGVRLNFETSTSLFEGDSIRVYLKGARALWDNNLFEIAGLHTDSSIVKLGVNKQVEPIVATIAQIRDNADYYKSRLVKIEGVQVRAADLGKVWAQPFQFGEVNLEDTLGNSIMIRTSGYARFAQQEVPSGLGSIIAIAGFYRDNFQLIVRRISEVQFDEPRWDDGSVPPAGSGSFEDPFNVSATIINNTGNGKWVEGYLVGVMETDVDPFVASFTPPFRSATNVIIADSPTETNLTRTIIVQLPVGEIRNVVNLKDNEGNLGKQIKLRGNLETYFGVPGMRNTDGYWLDGSGIVPDDPGETFFFENFATNLGPFTDLNILGSQSWNRQNWDGGAAVMSGHSGGSNFANENWLVSSQIDLTNRTNVILNIREAINYLPNNDYSQVKVLIASDFDGTTNPNEMGTWVDFSDYNRGSGSNWTFVNSGNIDISDFDGETIHIAFKYISTTAGAATWQVSEVKLFEGSK